MFTWVRSVFLQALGPVLMGMQSYQSVAFRDKQAKENLKYSQLYSTSTAEQGVIYTQQTLEK